MALLPVDEALRACSTAPSRLSESVRLLGAAGRVLAQDLDRAADAAAVRCLRHGRLCGARCRCRHGAGASCASSASQAGGPFARHGRAPARRRASSPAPACRRAPTRSSSRKTRERSGDTLDRARGGFGRRQHPPGRRRLPPGRRAAAGRTAARCLGHHPGRRRRPREPARCAAPRSSPSWRPAMNWWSRARKPGAGQIVSSNPYGLAALVSAPAASRGCSASPATRSKRCEAKLREGAGADVLVTIGGASVGDHDLVRPALEARGMALDFWKVAMRPGKPMLFGRLGAQRVLGLPGNPVSCLVAARVFLVPLIFRLLGRTDAAAARAVGRARPPAGGQRPAPALHARHRDAGRRRACCRSTALTTQDSAAHVGAGRSRRADRARRRTRPPPRPAKRSAFFRSISEKPENTAPLAEQRENG